MSDLSPPFEPPRTPQGYTANDLEKNPTLSTHLLIGLYASLTTMVNTVTNFGEKVTLLTAATQAVHDELTDVDTRQRTSRRHDRILYGFGFLILAVVIVGVSIIAVGNRDQLKILHDATSPAAAKAQQDNTQHVVLQIDCNEEENNRQLLAAVREIIPQVSVPQTRQECLQFKENG